MLSACTDDLSIGHSLGRQKKCAIIIILHSVVIVCPGQHAFPPLSYQQPANNSIHFLKLTGVLCSLVSRYTLSQDLPSPVEGSRHVRNLCWLDCSQIGKMIEMTGDPQSRHLWSQENEKGKR